MALGEESTNSANEIGKPSGLGGTGQPTPPDRYAQEFLKAAADSLKNFSDTQDEVPKLKKSTEALKVQIKKLSEQVIDIQTDAKGAEFRSIEAIGVISSIIALVLVFTSVSTGLSVISIKSAYLILLTVACSLILFASLIHSFFSTKKLGVSQSLLSIGLPILIILAVGIWVLFGSEERVKEQGISTDPSLSAPVQTSTALATSSEK
jgi:hypothetical protein